MEQQCGRVKLPKRRRAYLEEVVVEEFEEHDNHEEDSSSLLESPFFLLFFFWALTSSQSGTTRSRRSGGLQRAGLNKVTSEHKKGKATKCGQRDTRGKRELGEVTRNTKGKPDIGWFRLRGLVADGVGEDDLPRG